MGKWRTRVDRWMAVINKRGPFDISEYKQKIAEKFLSLDQSSYSEKNQKGVSFTNLMKGEKRAEVCRYFLTALLMSNEQAIELGYETLEENEIDVDDARLIDQQLMLPNGIGKWNMCYIGDVLILS